MSMKINPQKPFPDKSLVKQKLTMKMSVCRVHKALFENPLKYLLALYWEWLKYSSGFGYKKNGKKILKKFVV